MFLAVSFMLISIDVLIFDRRNHYRKLSSCIKVDNVLQCKGLHSFFDSKKYAQPRSQPPTREDVLSVHWKKEYNVLCYVSRNVLRDRLYFKHIMLTSVAYTL